MKSDFKQNIENIITRRSLLAGSSAAAMWQVAAGLGSAEVVIPKGQLHHQPKANRFLMIFLTGGMSHIDTFDPKPELDRLHGKTVDGFNLRGVSKLPLLRSPYTFRKHGQSGISVSDLFTHLPGVIDDLCIIRSMKTDIVEHFQATLAMHTGVEHCAHAKHRQLAFICFGHRKPEPSIVCRFLRTSALCGCPGF